MMDLITEHIATWTAAEIPKANGGRGRGRGSNGQSPHGIKKLRELILELAVRGKLVPQNPNDEPASVLLEKIAKEKVRLIKEGKIKKQKQFPRITENEKPYKLPKEWAWFRAGNVFDFQYGKAMPAKSRDVSGDVDVYGSNGVVGSHTDALVDEPCIIIGRKGSAGALTKALKPSWTTDVAYFLIPPSGFDFDYTFLLLQFLRLDELGKGIKPGLNRNEAYELVASLPPLKEQHRIVAKVDELMALCDKLEQQQTDSNDTHQTLVKTLLATLTTVADPAEFAVSWQRIVDHFDTLFTTEESIDQLKQTILQLAVMGKLVPQNPKDEPASILLKKITKEKARLIKEGKIKKQKPLPAINEKEVPFDLPQGWAWTRFPELGEFGRGKSKHRPRNDPSLYSGGKYPMVQTGDVARATREIKTYTAMYNDKGLAQSRLWPKGTMCITIAANIADSGILEFEACFPDSVVGLIPSKEIEDSRYFEYFMRTAKENLMVFAPSTAQKNINLGILETVYVPLPPAEEIKRIVAKVDELMALCDTLKERLHNAQITQVQLADVIVEQAVA